MIEVQGELTEQDYVHAQWLRIKPRRRYRLLTYILIPLAVLGVAIAIAALLSSRAEGAVLAVCVAVAVVLAPRSFRRSWQRIYRGQPGLRGLQRIEFSESGWAWETIHGSGKTDWSLFVKWRESPHMFILYQSSNLFNMIPKHWFGADPRAIDQFRELLRARAIPCVD